MTKKQVPTVRISRRLRDMRTLLRTAENAVAALTMEVEAMEGNDADDEIQKRLSIEERLKDMARELIDASELI